MWRQTSELPCFFNEDVDQAGIDRIGSEISSQTDMVEGNALCIRG
jgi:hypothetical protein